MELIINFFLIIWEYFKAMYSNPITGIATTVLMLKIISNILKKLFNQHRF